MRSSLKKSVILTGAFSGGIITGYMLARSGLIKAPKNYPAVYKQGLEELENAISRVRELRSRVYNHFKEPIPNLYKATEGLTLKDEELIF